MTDAELLTEIRRIRYGYTMCDVARHSGISRAELYRMLNSGRISAKHKPRLEKVLQPVSKQPSNIRRSVTL